MSLNTWLALLAICLLGAMSPGPSLAMVVRHTLGSSRKHGILCAWAHAFGIGIYALLTLLGLAVLMTQVPMVFTIITVIGALYLAWLGVQSLRSKGSMTSKLTAGESKGILPAMGDGLAISLFNPKIMLFFVALFSQFVLAVDNQWGQYLIVLTPFLVDGLWYTLIVLLISQSMVLEKLREKTHIIDKVAGVVLILLAIRVLVLI